jgi:LytR cell envelope-related transcriptional attenuator
MDADRPHSGGSSGSLSVVRAAAVLIVFVVAVSVLVAVGTRPTVSGAPSSATATTAGVTATTGHGATTSTPSSTPSGAASSTTTTTKPARHHGSASTSNTTTSTVPHGSVSVVVANATSTNGLAAHFTQVLSGAGWQMQTPIDASTSEATSAVYYVAGQEQAAQEVASAIGVKPTQVLPVTTSVPVAGVTGIDVVVVIGQDLAGATTTTTGGS